MKDETSDWALASRAHFRGAYLFGLLAFVLFSLMLSFGFCSNFFLQGHWQFTKHLGFFSGVHKENPCNVKGVKPWECWKKKKKTKGQMLPLKKKILKKVQHFTEWRFIVLLFRTLGLNSVVLFCLTFFVLCSCLISWTISSLYVLC